MYDAVVKIGEAITHISLFMNDGIECSILDLVGARPNLRKLKLMWPPPDSKLEPGVILKAVELAPRLEYFSLTYVRVPLSDITGVMKVLGPHLKVLKLTFSDQDELPWDRLRTIIRTIPEHNPALEKMEAVDDAIQELVFLTEEENNRLIPIRTSLRMELCPFGERAEQEEDDRDSLMVSLHHAIDMCTGEIDNY